MSYKAVIFDWGGVVTDDPGNSFFSDVLSTYGATDEQIKNSLRFFQPFSRGEISEREFWNLVGDASSLDLPETINGTFAHWSGIAPNERVLEYVSELKEIGYVTAILSNVIEPTYLQIKRSGGYDAFDYVIASCIVGHIKPEPEIYEMLLKKINFRPEECIFIDDQERCLAPARVLGMETILGESAEQIINEINLKING